MKSGELIVKSHGPWRRIAIIALWVGVVLLIAGAYELGLNRAGFKRLEFEGQRDKLEERLATEAKTNANLQERLTVQERTQAIDKQSYKDVRKDLKQLQEEILELREEVEFYRGIVSPTERQAGLNIQTFKLQQGGEAGLYHFELVMSQVLKNDRYVTGVVKLYLQGAKQGEPLTLNFSDISPNDSVGRNFKFRYFQRMEGDIRLPEDFVPRNVMVEMAPRGRKQISQSFSWQIESD